LKEKHEGGQKRGGDIRGKEGGGQPITGKEKPCRRLAAKQPVSYDEENQDDAGQAAKNYGASAAGTQGEGSTESQGQVRAQGKEKESY